LTSDPVLLQGREGRWQWPWALAGTLITLALVTVLARPVELLEGLAEKRHWIARDLLELTLDPKQPFTFADVAIAALPYIFCPLLVLVCVHGVSWRRAFAYRGTFDWSLFLKAALAFLLVGGLAELPAVLSEPQDFALQPRGLDFLPWALLGMVAIYAQSLGEEVLFKGYLLRVLGAVFPFRWLVVLPLVAAFTALHIGNTDLKRDPVFSLFYFALGEVIAFAIFLRTQNLAACAGVHWMNNVWSSLLVASAPDQSTTLALVVKTDPTLADGQSSLLDPAAHAVEIAHLALLLALLFWRRSPFYLPVAPARAAEEPGG
jgi:membrane protease YdiL (CAAX protease family)